MKKILAAAVLAVCAAPTFAAELFPNKQADQYTSGSELPAASTVGGYALYQGDESWKLFKLSTQQTGSLRDAAPLTLGIVQLQQFTSLGEWSANMYVVASLSSAGPNQYMSGTPCAGDHLIAVNKGRGFDDNCLTVDAQPAGSGPNPATTLLLQITHAKSSGRLYRIVMYINLAPSGFADTVPADWTPAAVKAVPERAAFVQRLQKWGESLQNGSERALDFNKPQDAFAGIPSYRTLLPALVASGFPPDFLRAVADVRSRPGFRALAYSQVGARQFRWQSRNGMDDQATADEQAMGSCESARPKAAPPCKLYDLNAAEPPQQP